MFVRLSKSGAIVKCSLASAILVQLLRLLASLIPVQLFHVFSISNSGTIVTYLLASAIILQLLRLLASLILVQLLHAC